MITILHRGGTAKRLQYYIGRGGSTEPPKSDYVIYGCPLTVTTYWLKVVTMAYFIVTPVTTQCYKLYRRPHWSLNVLNDAHTSSTGQGS